MSKIRNLLFYCMLAVALTLSSAATLTSCKKKSYPCPGLGQSNEADMSMFDEEGKLKESKKGKAKKNKESGLINKKNPKRIRAPRKTHI